MRGGGGDLIREPSTDTSGWMPLVFPVRQEVYWLPNMAGPTGPLRKGEILRTRGHFLDGTHRFEWEVLSTKTPRALKITNLLTKEERDDIIANARPGLAASQVINVHAENRTSHAEARASIRSSSGMSMQGNRIETMGNLAYRRRVRLLAGLGADNWLEATQVLQYLKGQQYVQHKDYFDADDFLSLRGGGQRIASIVTQLNLCEEGGATDFPLAKMNGTGGPFTAKLQPGEAVLFYDMDENYHGDITSTHAGKPPEGNSHKWAGVLWMHSRPYG